MIVCRENDGGRGTTDGGPRTADHGRRTTDGGPRTADHGRRVFIRGRFALSRVERGATLANFRVIDFVPAVFIRVNGRHTNDLRAMKRTTSR
jgi:hypothetical protein